MQKPAQTRAVRALRLDLSAPEAARARLGFPTLGGDILAHPALPIFPRAASIAKTKTTTTSSKYGNEVLTTKKQCRFPWLLPQSVVTHAAAFLSTALERVTVGLHWHRFELSFNFRLVNGCILQYFASRVSDRLCTQMKYCHLMTDATGFRGLVFYVAMSVYELRSRFRRCVATSGKLDVMVGMAGHVRITYTPAAHLRWKRLLLSAATLQA